MDFYDRFDTGAPDTQNSSNDYGITTSLGYEFWFLYKTDCVNRTKEFTDISLDHQAYK